ncbi:MAG: chemotaxis protein CheD [Caulobacteraceae bacterium]
MDRIVGIGEYVVSNNKNDTIKTFALGSCVAITVYSPSKNVAGMAHIALPSPDLSSDDGSPGPCYYAITAVPFLINKICSEFGCLKGELIIEIFGGAKSVRDNDVFKIGQKNVETVKRILNDLNLVYNATKTGGTYSRTLEMDVATGKVKVALRPIRI